MLKAKQVQQDYRVCLEKEGSLENGAKMDSLVNQVHLAYLDHKDHKV